MSRLAARAERIKLESLLNQSDGDLRYLEALSVDTLIALRTQVTTVFFEGHASLFQRLANAGGVMPLKVRTLIAEKALGPTVCARVAGHTPVDRAVAMAEKLHVPFLADVATRMDPQRAQPLLQGLSTDKIAEVARELADRGDVMTLGQFVDSLAIEVTEQVMGKMNDDAAVLGSTFFVNDRSQLDEVTRQIPQAQLKNIIAAGQRNELYIEALALMQSVEADLGRDLADLSAAEPGFFAGMIETIHAEGLWGDALPLARNMNAEARQQLLQLPRLAEDEVVRGLLESCQTRDGLDDLAALAPDMSTEGRAALVRAASELGVSLPPEIDG